MSRQLTFCLNHHCKSTQQRVHEIEGASTETHHQSTVVFFFYNQILLFCVRSIQRNRWHRDSRQQVVWSSLCSCVARWCFVYFISGGVYPIPCLQASCPASVVTSGDILAPISVYPPLEGFPINCKFFVNSPPSGCLAHWHDTTPSTGLWGLKRNEYCR